jgi:fused signal recognition particle receptor
MKSILSSFEKLKQGLAKTKNNLLGKLNQILGGKTQLDENTIEQIRETLYLADVGFEVTEKIIELLEKSFSGTNSDHLNIALEIIKKELKNILLSAKNHESGIDFTSFKVIDNITPKVILVVGVNGTGKTTSLGKLAYNFKLSNQSVLIAAADTFRAAANDQLAIWANRASVEIIENVNTKDPGAVVYEAIDKAIKNSIDIVLVDTAGRLHTKTDLMNELNKILRVVEKKLNRKPDEIFLVIDATTGQNAVKQIENFLKYIPLTGLILTKLDGTAKGGVIFQIVEKYKIPIKFIGIGESIDDLQPFEVDNFINAIFNN